MIQDYVIRTIQHNKLCVFDAGSQHLSLLKRLYRIISCMEN